MGSHRADAAIAKVVPLLYRHLVIGTVVGVAAAAVWGVSAKSRHAELIKHKKQLAIQDAFEEKEFQKMVDEYLAQQLAEESE